MRGQHFEHVRAYKSVRPDTKILFGKVLWFGCLLFSFARCCFVWFGLLWFGLACFGLLLLWLLLYGSNFVVPTVQIHLAAYLPDTAATTALVLLLLLFVIMRQASHSLTPTAVDCVWCSHPLTLWWPLSFPWLVPLWDSPLTPFPLLPLGFLNKITTSHFPFSVRRCLEFFCLFCMRSVCFYFGETGLQGGVLL